MEHHLNHSVMGVQGRLRKNFCPQSPQKRWILTEPRVCVKDYCLGRERNLKGRRKVKVEQKNSKGSPFRDFHVLGVWGSERITVMNRVEIFEEDDVCVRMRFTFMSM